LAVCKKDDGFEVFVGRVGQDGGMAGRVEAKNDFRALGIFEANALGSDRNAAVGADLEAGSEAPNVRPPRAFGCGSQHGTFFFFCQLPGVKAAGRKSK